MAGTGKKIEVCCGCGAQAPEHPMVAIVKKASGDSFEARPVCDICHQDPANRKTLIKGHFFTRAEGTRAAALAGSSIIQA